ncbi:RxLR-like protein [Plasmopara halstedii]|uniref:Elicitin n=1 Tax=Plasmopara halstedii TaxID=4781 RepID=A0A0P1AZF9_PLAHL|nr:RxLR-like protein [Plasmopara halstedii]CEG47260.1 RxLR-like protein [Plasmopara halstedii]|eukprot:XP_024583629.1 RxLR-like protein [Plasmopara halstedii]
MNLFTIFSVLLASIAEINLIYAKVCTSRDLSVFNEVSSQVSKCFQDSKVTFLVPPRKSLTKSQQSALCKSKACQEMIGSMDDLDIPNCEATFDLKNMTLQSSLDKFVAACDTTTSTPMPIKRRKSLESSSSSDSGSFSKDRRYSNGAAAAQFELLPQLSVLVAIAMISLGLLLP